MKFSVFDNPQIMFQKMISDIESAKKSIHLETYIYDNDEVGIKFRNALTKKASQGIEVKILLDAFGATVNKKFFTQLIANGAEVRFFREFRWSIRIFSQNHERNHRKLLIIDDRISYIGSPNITATCLEWRELAIRFESGISKNFKESFIKSWNLSRLFSPQKIVYKTFDIISDIPSGMSLTEEKYISLLDKAEKRILIETPYLAPPYSVREAFRRAIGRGVEVIVILPYISDVKASDIIRNVFLGKLYLQGVKIFYYQPKILHSKLLLIDNKFFFLGSSNLDYRSFIYQYEINLIGEEKNIINSLQKYSDRTLKDSVPFDYGEWQQRSSLTKMAELFLAPAIVYF